MKSYSFEELFSAIESKDSIYSDIFSRIEENEENFYHVKSVSTGILGCNAILCGKFVLTKNNCSTGEFSIDEKTNTVVYSELSRNRVELFLRVEFYMKEGNDLCIW